MNLDHPFEIGHTGFSEVFGVIYAGIIYQNVEPAGLCEDHAHHALGFRLARDIPWQPKCFAAGIIDNVNRGQIRRGVCTVAGMDIVDENRCAIARQSDRVVPAEGYAGACQKRYLPAQLHAAFRLQPTRLFEQPGGVFEMPELALRDSGKWNLDAVDEIRGKDTEKFEDRHMPLAGGHAVEHRAAKIFRFLHSGRPVAKLGAAQNGGIDGGKVRRRAAGLMEVKQIGQHADIGLPGALAIGERLTHVVPTRRAHDDGFFAAEMIHRFLSNDCLAGR